MKISEVEYMKQRRKREGTITDKYNEKSKKNEYCNYIIIAGKQIKS